MGCWLQMKNGRAKIRDGENKTDKMIEVTQAKPVYFENLDGDAFAGSPDVKVVDRPAPPPAKK